MNSDPAPSMLFTLMLPPCTNTSSRTSARPMPVPSFVLAFVLSKRENLSKIRSIFLEAIPIPESLILNSAYFFVRPIQQFLLM
jgi:hypothetical protein